MVPKEAVGRNVHAVSTCLSRCRPQAFSEHAHGRHRCFVCLATPHKCIIPRSAALPHGFDGQLRVES